MSQEALPSTKKPSASLLRLPIVLCIIYCLALLLRINFDIYTGVFIFALAGVWLAGAIIVSIFCLFFTDTRQAALRRFAQLIAISLAWAGALYAQDFLVLQGLKVRVLVSSELEQCKKTAVPVGKQGSVSRCELRDHGTSANFIIYDSTDNIGNIEFYDYKYHSWRSTPQYYEWYQTVSAQHIINTDGPLDVKKIADHFYFVIMPL
jgi:hypothetical protein